MSPAMTETRKLLVEWMKYRALLRDQRFMRDLIQVQPGSTLEYRIMKSGVEAACIATTGEGVNDGGMAAKMDRSGRALASIQEVRRVQEVYRSMRPENRSVLDAVYPERGNRVSGDKHAARLLTQYLNIKVTEREMIRLRAEVETYVAMRLFPGQAAA